MDAQSLEKLSRAVYESLRKEVLLRHDYAVAVWPEVCKSLAVKGIRGEVLRPEETPKNGIWVSQESGIWIRLWAPTIFSSDTFWAVVPEEIAMRILVLGELP